MGTARRVIAIILCGMMVTMAWAGHSPVSPTSAANKVPVAGSDGKIAEGYLPALSQSTGGTGTTNGAGATSITYTTQSGDFTASSGQNYELTGAAGVHQAITMPSSPSDGDEILFMRVGAAAGIVWPSTTITLNGIAARSVALRPGRTLMRYDSTSASWWTDNEIGLVPNAGLVMLLTAQKGVTTSGADVTAWTEQSSNAYASSAVGATAPQYSATGLGNHPGISFSANNSNVQWADGAQWNLTDTVWSAALKITGTGSGYIAHHLAASTGWAWGLSSGTPGAQFVVYNASSIVDTAGARRSGSVDVIQVQKVASPPPANTNAYYEGIPTGAIAGGTIGDGAATLYVGSDNATTYTRGTIGALIIHNTLLTYPQILAIARWLAYTTAQ